MESCDGAGGGVRGIAGWDGATRVEEDELDDGKEKDEYPDGNLRDESRDALGRVAEADGG